MIEDPPMTQLPWSDLIESLNIDLLKENEK